VCNESQGIFWRTNKVAGFEEKLAAAVKGQVAVSRRQEEKCRMKNAK
jgi:hypothetical protein